MRVFPNICIFPLSAIILWWLSLTTRGDLIVYTMGVPLGCTKVAIA